MPTRPSASDPAGTGAGGAGSPFAGLGAGLEFFQDWMKAASSALPNLGGAASAGTGAWAMPTLDPEELDKRIQELKTVQFWLEQNARMIGMTIQTLEVQRMTLQTLRGMKVPVDALRESLKASAMPPAPAAPPAEAPAAAAAAAAASPSEAPPAAAAVDPMAWWNTLANQFTQLATQAVQAGQDAMSGMQMPASPTPASDATPEPAAAPASPAARTRSRRAAPRTEPASGSDAAPPAAPRARKPTGRR